MNLQRRYAQAVVSLALSIGASVGAAEPAEVRKSKEDDLNALAIAELRILSRYVSSPTGLTIEALAQQLRFTHSIEKCTEVQNYQNYCLYALDNQQSPVARILTLGIGRSKASGLPGARIDWTPWSDHVCITADHLQPLLGAGDVIDVNVPYVAPGSTATPPAYRTALYATIPGAVPGATAKVAFREKCVTEIDFTF